MLLLRLKCMGAFVTITYKDCAAVEEFFGGFLGGFWIGEGISSAYSFFFKSALLAAHRGDATR